MGGGGKKHVSVFSAVSNAVRHALGALSGFDRTFGGILDSFKHVYDRLKKVYDTLGNWVNEKFGPLIAAWKKLEDVYAKHVKPWLDWADKKLRWVVASFELFRGKVWKAIQTLDSKAFGWVKDLHNRVDKVLQDVQDLARIFSKKLAESIQHLRDEIRKETIGRINRLEASIYHALDRVWFQVFGRIEGFLDWAYRHTHYVKTGMEKVFDDMNRILLPDQKPRASFARDLAKKEGDRFIKYIIAKYTENMQIKPYEPPPIPTPAGTDVIDILTDVWGGEFATSWPTMAILSAQAEIEKELEGEFANTFKSIYGEFYDDEHEVWDVEDYDVDEIWNDFFRQVDEKKVELPKTIELDKDKIYDVEMQFRITPPNPPAPPEKQEEPPPYEPPPAGGEK